MQQEDYVDADTFFRAFPNLDSVHLARRRAWTLASDWGEIVILCYIIMFKNDCERIFPAGQPCIKIREILHNLKILFSYCTELRYIW